MFLQLKILYLLLISLFLPKIIQIILLEICLGYQTLRQEVVKIVHICLVILTYYQSLIFSKMSRHLIINHQSKLIVLNKKVFKNKTI